MKDNITVEVTYNMGIILKILRLLIKKVNQLKHLKKI